DFSDTRYSYRQGANRTSGIGRTCRLAVDQLLQFLAGLEVRDLLRGHGDLHSGLRVATHPGAALAQAERSESPQLDLLTVLQGANDGVEDRVHDGLRLLLRDVRRHGHALDQLRLRHIHPRSKALPVLARRSNLRARGARRIVRLLAGALLLR